ncbi:branched-chain amino acid ABC transporter permease [Micromonospora endolithica]|uniref:Branched-chain amino acid ABC transporter permease n=1 Tax=Micromonospora endolithica TaxID=230091 RepID=A0A3A9YX15_9ACTN|nr:branched-chain amino acid ABC transporter permease [Micromonospora endolithica]RKN40652.1 branched-chain amino acid ABC transporter permease [Micromonospora endolithica]TWJ21743.1 branched-chain amino acid transport system permease protein [Micromonospora endolithica]
MTELIESLLRGLGTGSVYALLALGFVIIYKATRVISFAQPAFMLAGVVAVTYLTPTVGFWAAVPLAAAGTGLLALGVERTAVRPMVGRPAFVVAIITLGVDVAVRVVVNAFIGLDVRHVGDPWGLRTLAVGPVEMQQRHLAAVVAAALLVAGLFAFFRYTRTGLAMRAAALDQEAALAHGVSVGAVFAVSWALAGGLAAVAGTFAAAGGSVDGALWLIALTALPVIILGGLDSLPGAVVGGLAVGVLQELTATYANDVAWLGGNVSVITPYVLMLVVLLVRPYGLFGTREVERV